MAEASEMAVEATSQALEPSESATALEAVVADEGGGGGDQAMGPLKKAVTSFVHFCSARRAAAKEAHAGASAPEILRFLAEEWRGLSDEAKQPYNDLATADRARYDREKILFPDGGKKPAAKALEPHEIVIPIARVKKICKLDPEVKSLSKEATALIGKAAELFLDHFATETHGAAAGKRTLKPSDVQLCVQHRPHLAWLRADYPASDYTPAPRPQKKQALAKPDGNTTMTQFFAARPAPADSTSPAPVTEEGSEEPEPMAIE